MPAMPRTKVDYRKVVPYKTKLLNAAYERFKKRPKDSEYRQFCSKNKAWLDDFTMFIALRKRFRGDLWCRWPVELRDRHRDALKAVKAELRDAVDKEKFLQWQFFSQWFSLRDYCNQRAVGIIGDIPI